MGLNHIRIPRNKYKNGVFNIQIVNNYHKRLKDLIFGTFKGVATKYLNNYIVYHNFAKDAKANKKVVLFDFIRNTFCQSKTAEIAKRPAIPIRYLTNIQLKLFDNKCRNRLMDNEIEVLRRSNHELYKIWVNVNQVAKALSMSEQANLPINHT